LRPFVRWEIVYQEVPQPGASSANNTNKANEYDYLSSDILGSPGYLHVTVMPDQVRGDYIRTYLPQDENLGRQNEQVDYSYSVAP